MKTTLLQTFLSQAGILDGKTVSGLNNPATFHEDRDSMDEFLELELESLSALECALHNEYTIFPNSERLINPVDYLMLRLAQVQQEGMSALPQHDPLHYSIQTFGRSELVCYHAEQNDNWKIVIPDQLLTHLISWYHFLLNHTVQGNLEKTIKATFFHPKLSANVREYVHFCPVCQKYKAQG